MAKKEKRYKPERVPTKRQLSKWQRERRIRRIIIGVAIVFLVGIIGYVVYGYYDSKIKPFREVIIEVNEASFNMGYYIDMLDAQTKGTESSYIAYFADMVAQYVMDAELMSQRAQNLEIVVTNQEMDEKIKENKLPDNKTYRDIVRADLLREKLQEYFASQLPERMEQAHIQVMLVESEQVAANVMAKIGAGGNFTAFVEEFSCDSQVEGDLGWLPQELMPKSLIGDAAFSLESGEVHQPIYDESASKSIGYWLIEVTDRMRRRE